MFGYISMFSKGNNFHDFLFAYLQAKVFHKMGSSHWGKDLLRLEQILSSIKWLQFILEATMKMTELFPLEVHPFTLNGARGRGRCCTFNTDHELTLLSRVCCFHFFGVFLAFKWYYYSKLFLSYYVAVIQWITSCHKNRMTTRVITHWRVCVTSLTTCDLSSK